jgi:hypothetical protein
MSDKKSRGIRKSGMSSFERAIAKKAAKKKAFVENFAIMKDMLEKASGNKFSDRVCYQCVERAYSIYFLGYESSYITDEEVRDVCTTIREKKAKK